MIIKFKKTNLIICPSCEARGFREVLGEVDRDGNVIVQRFHRGYTKIVGNFFILCGRCYEEIYFKERREEVSGTFSNNGSERLHRDSSFEATAAIGSLAA